MTPLLKLIDTIGEINETHYSNVVTAALLATGLMAVNTAWSAQKLDNNLPTYKKAAGVSGNLSSVGSDTLANLMTLWAEEFKRVYPNVNIQIQAAGSSTAPPALTEGTSNIGPMSRKMKDKELQAFEKRFGYKPTAILSPLMRWLCMCTRIIRSKA